MLFIVDNMLPRAVATFLNSLGHDATMANRMKIVSGQDIAIWRRAEATGAIVISKDSDFEELARRSHTAKLIHFRGGNMQTADMVDRLRENLPMILAAFEAGENYVEFW